MRWWNRLPRHRRKKSPQHKRGGRMCWRPRRASVASPQPYLRRLMRNANTLAVNTLWPFNQSATSRVSKAIVNARTVVSIAPTDPAGCGSRHHNLVKRRPTLSSRNTTTGRGSRSIVAQVACESKARLKISRPRRPPAEATRQGVELSRWQRKVNGEDRV